MHPIEIKRETNEKASMNGDLQQNKATTKILEISNDDESARNSHPPIFLSTKWTVIKYAKSNTAERTSKMNKSK